MCFSDINLKCKNGVIAFGSIGGGKYWKMRLIGGGKYWKVRLIGGGNIRK